MREIWGETAISKKFSKINIFALRSLDNWVYLKPYLCFQFCPTSDLESCAMGKAKCLRFDVAYNLWLNWSSIRHEFLSYSLGTESRGVLFLINKQALIMWEHHLTECKLWGIHLPPKRKPPYLDQLFNTMTTRIVNSSPGCGAHLQTIELRKGRRHGWYCWF